MKETTSMQSSDAYEPPQKPNFQSISATEYSRPDTQQTAVARRISPAWTAIAALLGLGIVLLMYLWAATPVLVASVPEEAQIKMSGFAPSIGNSYLLLPGPRQISANAQGYYEYQSTFTVDETESQALNIALEPLPGHINIQSNVDDLSVKVNGEDSDAKLPGLLQNLPRGDYQLAFESYRYFPQTIDFTVDGFDQTQALTVEMLPAWGQMEITSTPEGAEVYIDGKQQGQTPLLAEVLETGTEVSITKSGFKPWSKTLTVTAGSEASYPTIILQPADGILTINSSPSGASLTIDGLFVGQTPFKVNLTSGQTHQLKVFAKGYQTLNKSMLLQAEEEQTVNWQLKPELGDIALQVSPANAQVYINGKPYKNGSQTLSLLAAEQLLEVRLPGYVSQQRKIIPRPGLTQSVSIALLTKQQHYWAQFPGNVTGPAGIKLKLMRPDTTFTMGTARRESGRRSNEVERNVRIDKPFYVGKYEVTNRQFKQFMPDHNSLQLAGSSLDHPDQAVVNVSWLDAVNFCNWLSEQAGLRPVYTVGKGRLLGADLSANGFRLPTEAEWAWVARVDDNGALRRYSWGDSYPPPLVAANYADARAQNVLGKSVPGYDDGYSVAAPVGSFPSDAKGLFDIAGNVSEWVHDFYAITPNRGEPELNPTGPENGRHHVVRGASWKHGSRTEIRLSYRNFASGPSSDLGFRVARNIE